MSGQLNVMLQGRHIATITNAPGDVNYIHIERDYANDPNAPTLSFKAFRNPLTGRYYETVRPTQTVAHPYFSNVLPEGPLRTYLAAHAHVKPVRDFPLLWLLGRDLPGALILVDSEGTELPPYDSDHMDATTAPEQHPDPDMLRFSLAGVQLKFSAGGDPERGLTIPVSGMGGRWIVKLPDRRYAGVPENEYSAMTFAKAVGIDVPRVGLTSRDHIGGVPMDMRFDGNAYYIERFDRGEGNVRIHTEDFAQANGLFPAEKYKRFNFDRLTVQVADLMGSEAAMELLERIVFNVGIGNGDMHAKNWSVIYYDGRTPSLAPAYDYLSTLTYVETENMGMNLDGTKKFHEIDMSRMRNLAATARLSTRIAESRIRRMVSRMRDVWPTMKDALPLTDEIREAITTHMDTVPLFAGTPTTYSLSATKAAARGGPRVDGARPRRVQREKQD